MGKTRRRNKDFGNSKQKKGLYKTIKEQKKRKYKSFQDYLKEEKD